MAEEKQLEFYLLRYVPTAVREEFVNIGLIMIELGFPGFADARFLPGWKAAERVDSQVDIEMLQAVERYVRAQLGDPAARQILLRKMEDSFSNLIQLSAKSVCLADDPAKELEALASFYFKVIRPPTERLVSGRSRIWQQMRTAFEHEGILGALMKDIPMEKYNEEGDPLKLDFAYNVGEKLKVFQAVSLDKRNLGPANSLGLQASNIIQIFAKKNKSETFLTAIVEDDWDRTDKYVVFAHRAMARNDVKVLGVAEMPRIAHEAKLELRM